MRFRSAAFPSLRSRRVYCNIQPGDVIAVWGCGPVGQLAIQSAFLMGPDRVIAVDRFRVSIAMAQDHSRAETLNYEEVDVSEALREMTGGRGPDACIDAVGLEAHGAGLLGAYDRVKQSMSLKTDECAPAGHPVLSRPCSSAS